MAAEVQDPAGCATCPVRRVAACPLASHPDLALVDRSRRYQRHRHERVISREGEACQTVSIVVHGFVKVTSVSADGRQQVLELKGPGRIVGHPFGSAWPHDHETTGDVLLCVFDRKVFESLVETEPSVTRAMLAGVLDEVRSLHGFMSILGCAGVTERLARYFLLNCGVGDIDPVVVRLPVNRRDLASLLGTTPETISRFVQSMARAGVVEARDFRTYVVTDLHALEAVAGLTAGGCRVADRTSMQGRSREGSGAVEYRNANASRG